ncbi:MAG TPA: S8 family peptidase [Candidatus Bathyarchaeia archaeon]|nr:S8 family peptidase [Candidatus Bathyarchaeia archaeon]
MKKPSSHLTILTTLTLIILLQEGIILFKTSSLGTTEAPWFKQWPFNVDDSSNATCDFAYNGSHVELVLGVSEGKESYQKLSTIITQNEGDITSKLSTYNKTRSIIINVPTNKVSNLIKEVMKNNGVKYLEPNWKAYADAIPNDPEWTNQWGPAKIQANMAWNTQKGNNTILVAIVDTGIKYTHPDLVANYVPLGYDWINNDSDPMDDQGHGTHCAGIIAASINNSIGIAGLAQVRIMAEKGLSRQGWGYDDELANAIIHAVNQGAKIISCSWGSSEESQLIHDAVKYATDAGALVIAAAGNSGTNTKHYPAAYPEVIAVAATDENDRLAPFSSYGDWIDIAAPGTSIYSTYLWNDYLSLSGTSMACPHVAGVAALEWSQFPEMANEQVRSQLMYTADDLGTPGFDVYYGYGRVDARKAVSLSAALIGSKVVDAPANSVYFLYLNPIEGVKAETAYDAIASGILYGLDINQQQQQFMSTSNLVLASGELDSSRINNSVVVLFGGPCPQKTVGYYENMEKTPLRFAANATHFMFVTQANVTIAALSRVNTYSGHEDMFTIEVFKDKTNLIVIMYGFGWKGTWASGIYLKEVISKNLNAYSENCYVFHWIDSPSQDGVPQSNEIHQEYPTP